jgi:hypothetical protein
MSAVNFDSNSAGTLLLDFTANATGSIPPASVSAVDGRATLSISQALLTGPPAPASSIVYIVNANEMFIMGADPFALNEPVYSGKAIVSAASYTSAAIVGNQMVHLTGQNSCTIGSQQTPCASVAIGALSFSATSSTAGTFVGDIFNFDQTNGVQNTNISSASPATFTIVSAIGRLTVANDGNAGNHPPIFYLATPQSNTEAITAFILGTDSAASFGASETGAAAAITTSSLAGKYFLGNDDPADNTVKNRVEVLTLSSIGTFTGTANTSGQSALQFLNADSGAITITNTPDVGVGNAGVQSIVITNGKRILVIDESPGGSGPTIIIIEVQ